MLATAAAAAGCALRCVTLRSTENGSEAKRSITEGGVKIASARANEGGIDNCEECNLKYFMGACLLSVFDSFERIAFLRLTNCDNKLRAEPIIVE